MRSASKKSNIDYVREHIETFGSPALKNEALEFLDAISEEIEELKTNLADAETERDKFESERDDLESENEKLSEKDDYFYTVDCGIGTIEWRASALPLIQAMEEFTNRVGASYIPNSLNFV